MKKNIAAALTAAMVVGAASTTFAAANPFSDLDPDHWAYQSVMQLYNTYTADGKRVIDGMGDGTFQGKRPITRYEVAQMVAKALARTDISGTDKAALDRLAAEFSDELNSLGVRVAELEKYADKVQWTGEMRYRYKSIRDENPDGSKDRSNKDWVHFRLFPEAEVNDHWKLKARLTATYETDTNDSTDFELTYGYAEGNYNKFRVRVGKQDLYSVADDGLVVDDFFSGAQLEFGSKVKVTAEAGRINLANSTVLDNLGSDEVANYQGVELNYNDGNKFNVGGTYRHFNASGLKTVTGYNTEGKVQDDADIWSAGTGYNFDKNVRLFYAYAQNPSADDYNRAWTGQLSYKGADKTAKSWGMWAAYRYVGRNVGIMPTYDVEPYNKKGVEVGLGWSPLNNTLTQFMYFNGKSLVTDKDTETLFARVSFFF
ncbi:MAG: S-layer homology domain-containing protein [Selenomonadaceae bacterium]|nr:S-layer homology domain-containing protein [Selenomonadaceae bacterium]